RLRADPDHDELLLFGRLGGGPSVLGEFRARRAMKQRVSRIVDYLLYVTIGLGIVFAIVAGAIYDPGHGKWIYLSVGTAIGLGIVLSIHESERRYPRFWSVLLILTATETVLVGIVFRSPVFDRLAGGRGINQLLIFGIAIGESLLNGWVL